MITRFIELLLKADRSHLIPVKVRTKAGYIGRNK